MEIPRLPTSYAHHDITSPAFPPDDPDPSPQIIMGKRRASCYPSPNKRPVSVDRKFSTFIAFRYIQSIPSLFLSKVASTIHKLARERDVSVAEFEIDKYEEGLHVLDRI